MAQAASTVGGRLRRVVGDPLLVPAGRGMAATPAARALREPVREALDAALGLLSPAGPADPASLHRTFTIRTSDVVTCLLAPALAAQGAPHVDPVRG